jgi:hypothetical protein
MLSSMTKDVLSQVTACKMANKTWQVIEGNFTSAKRACTVNSRIALATTKKGDLSIAEYMSKMRFLGDELATVGRLINSITRWSPPCWPKKCSLSTTSTPSFSTSSSAWCYKVPLSTTPRLQHTTVGPLMVEVDRKVVGALTMHLGPKDGALDAITSIDPMRAETTGPSANFVEEEVILL